MRRSRRRVSSHFALLFETDDLDTQFYFHDFHRVISFLPYPCMMAGKKKEHRSSRSKDKRPTGASLTAKGELPMPVLTPQLILTDAVDDGSTRESSLDTRLRELQNITPIMEKIGQAPSMTRVRQAHSLSRSLSPMQRLEQQFQETEQVKVGGRYDRPNSELLDRDQAKRVQDGGRYDRPSSELQDRESSSEGLASSENDSPAPSHFPDRGRTKGPSRFRIPKVPEWKLHNRSREQSRSISREHDRRFSRHGDRHGRRGMRLPDKGQKRQRSPTPEYNEYWYSYDHEGNDYGDDNEDYGDYEYDQEDLDYEGEDEYEYDGYEDYEYDESDNDYDDRYTQQSRFKRPREQKFQYQTESNFKQDTESRNWDKVQEQMAAKFAKKKPRLSADRPLGSVSQDRVAPLPKIPEVRDKPRKKLSSVAGSQVQETQQSQLEAKLAAQLIAQSTPRQQNVITTPMRPTPPASLVTPASTPVDPVDPVSTTRDRVIQLARATFDQVTAKSEEITEDYAKIVDEALRLVLV